MTKNPELNKERHALQAQRRELDPELKARHLDRQRERHARRQKDPTYLAWRREYYRQYYEKTLARMTPDELAAYTQRRSDASRRSAAKRKRQQALGQIIAIRKQLAGDNTDE
ncbi:hypothetical protein [Pseudoalteromonas rubra]|uniref:hypothetical protein n=1 Tax=Pseudoalteromonas rubra TaxID=43658 RepID=UPI000F79864A|nr:hypothetical protein [Pseudoalteromonas rubra]